MPLERCGFPFLVCADSKLMDRCQEEGRAEVYEKYDLSMMPTFHRVYMLIYVAWLISEGIISAVHKVTSSRTPALVAYGMEHSFMYFIIAGLLLVLLHTYIGRRVPRYCFRFIIFVHQSTIVALSLWRYACATTMDQAGPGFRVILLWFCVLGEAGAFGKEILDFLAPLDSKIREM